MAPNKPRKEPAEIKRPEDEAQDLAASVFDTVREPLIALDQDLRVIKVNRSFYEAFKIKPGETVGQHIYELGNKQLDIPSLRELLESIIPQTSTHDGYEIEYDFPDIGWRTLLINARHIPGLLGKETVTLLAIEDITERKLLEKALNEKASKLLSVSEEKYRSFVENINDVLLTLDTRGTITYISPVVERLSKYKVSELIGKSFTQLIYPDDRPVILDRFTRLLSGQLEPWEFRVLDKDGKIIFVRTSSRPLYKDGEVVGITTMLTDITDLKKIEEKLRDSQLIYRDLVNNSKSGVAVYEAAADGEDFIFKDFNHAAETIDNVKKEDIIGKNLLQTFPGVKEFGLFEVLKRVLRTGAPEHHPIAWYHDQRISGWRDNYVYRLSTGEIVVIYEDITVRKQSEDLLRREQIMLERTEGIAHIGSWEWDIATDTVTWSDELFRIFQRDPQEGAPSFAEHPAFYHPEDMARLRQAVEVCVADGTPYELELRGIRKDGETRMCIARGVAEMAPGGRAVRLFGSLQDITERKQAEEALSEKTRFMNNLIDSIGDPIFVKDDSFRFILVNNAFIKMLGIEMKNIIGKTLGESLPKDQMDHFLEIDAMVLKSGQENLCEEPLTGSNGDILTIVTRKTRYVNEHGDRLLVGVIRDITERKIMENALKESEGKFKAMVETMPLAIYLSVGVQQISEYISPTMVKLFGYTMEDIPTVAQWWPLAYPDETYRRQISENWTIRIKRAIETQSSIEPMETVVTCKDGSKKNISWGYITMGDKNYAFGLDLTERKQTEEKLSRSYESLKKTLNDAINTMVKIVETRDPYTAGHQQRVASLATAIARGMKLEDTLIDQLRTAAVIHDIGKMYVPSDILSKPGKLSNIEFDLIKTHAQGGYDIVKGMDFPGIVAEAVLQHHERLDGSGYPNNLKSEDTILEAKILAVADVVEAMSSHRPYRAALGIDKALDEISKNKGKLYDLSVVDICLELFKEQGFKFEE